MSYVGDGADKKVARIDAIKSYIKNAADKGRTRSQIYTFAERKLGLNPKRIEAYLRLLVRNREVREQHKKWFAVG